MSFQVIFTDRSAWRITTELKSLKTSKYIMRRVTDTIQIYKGATDFRYGEFPSGNIF